MAKTKKEDTATDVFIKIMEEDRKEHDEKLANFVSKVPPNDQRKVVKRPETIQQAMARGKRKAVGEVEYEPLIGYTCELCNQVNYVDVKEHIPTLRVCDDCKGKMKAKLSA